MILHIAEVAGLMFLAFVLGSALGYGARRLAMRGAKAANVIPPARLAIAKGEAAPPAVAPVPVPAVAATPMVATTEAAPVAPVTPKATPVPVVAVSAVPAGSQPTVAPSPVPVAASAPPSQPVSAKPPPAPARPASPPPQITPVVAATRAGDDDDIMVPSRASATAPVSSARAEAPDDVALLRRRSGGYVPIAAEPTSQPGIAWTGDLNGHAARRPVRVAATAPIPLPVVAAEPEAIVPPAIAQPAASAEPALELETKAAPAAEMAPVQVSEPPPAVPIEIEAAPETKPQRASEPEQVSVIPLAEAKPSPPATKVLFGEILPPGGAGGPMPEAADARADAMPEPPAVQSASAARPPLFADFTVPDFETTPDPIPEPPSPDEGNWPEPAPPHPHLQPGAEVVEPLPAAAGPAEPEADPPAEVPPPAPRESEDDAMRAIEGGWSGRRRGRADQPELIDVSSAVAAAQSAVQQVLAQTGGSMRDDAGKPQGLPRPRAGTRDDLRLITGVSGLDESTLNNLGIYHFDQIAAWTDAEVAWLEGHAFARGRIGREDWQQQARILGNQRPAPPRFARS